MARQPILPDEYGNYTPKQIERLKKRAMNVSIYALSQMMRTRGDLERKLKKRQIPEDIIEETLNTLEQKRLIDDRAYAEAFVHSKITYDKLGANSIRMKLRQKGVDDDIISEALNVIDEDEQYERALTFARKRAVSMRKLDKQKMNQRLVSQLAYKGYNGGVAFPIAQQVATEVMEQRAEAATAEDDEGE